MRLTPSDIQHVDAWACYAVTAERDGIAPGLIRGPLHGIAPGLIRCHGTHLPWPTRAQARAEAARLNAVPAGYTWRVARVRIITVWRP
jgi:hypothetical protein